MVELGVGCCRWENWRGIQLVVGGLVGPVAVVVLELALEGGCGRGVLCIG